MYQSVERRVFVSIPEWSDLEQTLYRDSIERARRYVSAGLSVGLFLDDIEEDIVNDPDGFWQDAHLFTSGPDFMLFLEPCVINTDDDTDE